jgi:hypothetical protein
MKPSGLPAASPSFIHKTKYLVLTVNHTDFTKDLNAGDTKWLKDLCHIVLKFG